MTPSQQEQKDRARAEAEEHLNYAAVDRMRDTQLAAYEANDARSQADMRANASGVRDMNHNLAQSSSLMIGSSE